MNEKVKNALPETSQARADSPSEEFCWSWLQILPTIDYGCWFRSEAEAVLSAENNFIGFHDNLKKYKVIIINATKGWNL